MINSKFCYQPVGTNKRKSLQEKNQENNTLNFEYKTTTNPSTSNAQENFQNQKNFMMI